MTESVKTAVLAGAALVLDRISVPTLILHAEDDPLASLKARVKKITANYEDLALAA